MNELIKIINTALAVCKKEGLLKLESHPEIVLDRPKSTEHGDFATNVALIIAKAEGKPPRKIAEDIVSKIPVPSAFLASVSVAGPGFINFKLNSAFLFGNLSIIFKAGEKYGHIDLGKGKKVQVEFVSANPTGPLHVGHGRGAVYGSALSNLLSCAGFKVKKEYYLNDAGVQMKTLGLSVWLRIQELKGRVVTFPENCYQGGYIRDIASELIVKDRKKIERGLSGKMSEEEIIYFCGDYAGKKIHEEIVKDLSDCGVAHDEYFYETTLHEKGEVRRIIELLMKKGDAYESEGAIWFKSTNYGDEKDRVLKKSDGAYTYFAADIAYHKNKYDRGFDRVIDIWGADHAGHVPRMKAAIRSIGRDPANLDVVLIQLVNLIRDGQLISMSTRSAQYETLRSLLDEVGRDVCRYFFLMRSHNAQLDFDLNLATSHTMDNPVYYIQYAHARICSVFEKAAAQGINLKKLEKADTTLLNLPDEAELVQTLTEYPQIIEAAARELEPHKIVFYLLELAKQFQGYYSKGKKDDKYRFLSTDKELSRTKCYLLKNIQIVLKNGLTLLSISAPMHMDSKEVVEGCL